MPPKGEVELLLFAGIAGVSNMDGFLGELTDPSSPGPTGGSVTINTDIWLSILICWIFGFIYGFLLIVKWQCKVLFTFDC